MNDCSIWDGVIIGASGGAIAGVAVYMLQQVHNHILFCWHSNRVENWLKTNTKDEAGRRYRSTKTIASHNNLTLDRVRYICSHSKKIYLSTGEEDDMWSVYIER